MRPENQPLLDKARDSSASTSSGSTHTGGTAVPKNARRNSAGDAPSYEALALDMPTAVHRRSTTGAAGGIDIRYPPGVGPAGVEGGSAYHDHPTASYQVGGGAIDRKGRGCTLHSAYA